jgi:hypothetical protein
MTSPMYSTRRTAAAAKHTLENRGSPFHIETSSEWKISMRKALQGGFYAVYDVHQAILSTAAGVGQSVGGMSDIPPAPPKSPIMIIVLLAIAGAAIALIGYIWAHL